MRRWIHWQHQGIALLRWEPLGPCRSLLVSGGLEDSALRQRCAVNDQSHWGYYCSRTQPETFVEDHPLRLFWEGVVCTLHHVLLMSSSAAVQLRQPLQLSDHRMRSRTPWENALRPDNTGPGGHGVAVEAHEGRSAAAADHLDTPGDVQAPRAVRTLHTRVYLVEHPLGLQKQE